MLLDVKYFLIAAGEEPVRSCSRIRCQCLVSERRDGIEIGTTLKLTSTNLEGDDGLLDVRLGCRLLCLLRVDGFRSCRHC